MSIRFLIEQKSKYQFGDSSITASTMEEAGSEAQYGL